MGLFSFLNKSKQDPDDDIDAPVKPRRRARVQQEEPIDPMLPEKKRARRRLIGATALVLAAVIGLPMIFDSEPKPLTDDIAIQIPSRDRAGVPVIASTAPLDSEPARSSSVVKAEPSSSEKLPVAEAVKPVPEKPADKPVDKATDKSTDKSHNKPAENVSADRDKSAAEKSNPSRVILQVAAVATKVKAEELQNRLKQAGIKSYLQKTSTKEGERYRVRVGPFATREEADKMRARLLKMGLSATAQPA